MSAAALRQARHRERARSGRIVLAIEVDEVQLAAALHAAGFIPSDSATREELACALERVVAIWTDEIE